MEKNVRKCLVIGGMTIVFWIISLCIGGIVKDRTMLFPPIPQSSNSIDLLESTEEDSGLNIYEKNLDGVQRLSDFIDDTQERDSVFTTIDTDPEFPGGEEALRLFIIQYLKYPAVAAENGIQGRVWLSFIIEKDGSVSEITVEKSPSPYLSTEAIRVISMMPKWKPGTLRGEPVRVKYTLPLTFRLQ